MSYELVIVGGGKMGSALAEGLLRAQWCAPERLAIVDHTASTRESLANRLAGVAVLPSLELGDVDEHTGALLCVKPDYAESVARTIGALGVRRLLSVVAGLTTARIESVMVQPVAVVRSMPNTPVLVGKGVSAIAGGAHVTADDLTWAESILGAVGTVVRVTERNIDVVTGLSGPMPAYLYLIVEALIEAGVYQGLPRAVAQTLVVDSLEGTAALLKQTGASPEELRHQVTSPGGTTAAGLRALENRSVRAAMIDAVSAAADRSRQLGR